MKTRIFLLLCLFLSVAAGCSKQDEICDENGSGIQLKSAGNLTITRQMEPSEKAGLYIPVICDGEIVDYLVADGNTHSVMARFKFEDGNLVRVLLTCKGYLQSQLTGHTYTFMEQDKIWFDGNGNIIKFWGVDNVKGEQGLHFLMICFVLDFDAGTYELQKAMCVPNADNKDL